MATFNPNDLFIGSCFRYVAIAANSIAATFTTTMTIAVAAIVAATVVVVVATNVTKSRGRRVAENDVAPEAKTDPDHGVPVDESKESKHRKYHALDLS